MNDQQAERLIEAVERVAAHGDRLIEQGDIILGHWSRRAERDRAEDDLRAFNDYIRVEQARIALREYDQAHPPTALSDILGAVKP